MLGRDEEIPGALKSTPRKDKITIAIADTTTALSAMLNIG
jgi:hypothetical protein